MAFCKKRHAESSHSVSDKSHSFSRKLKMYGFCQKPSRSSQSDIKCLDFVIKEMTGNRVSFLTKATHDLKFHQREQNVWLFT